MRNFVVIRLLRFWPFWEACIKKGGELMGFDLVMLDGKVKLHELAESRNLIPMESAASVIRTSSCFWLTI
ncbi:hypothetical protein Bca52824_024627 [Brassica carinata]|uniref:Uncharacterized protein n=1 Tax=Brassica carinata TaxID=52824 RepID=A0A8X7VKJ3_BRACI|nr:hypothetical protein Bca52824_024627 [Brassica carinata]